VAEQLQLARLCLKTRHFAAGAQLFAEAFESEPKQAEDLALAYRYDAARAAALAGCGKGIDNETLDDRERTRWRKQALAWLRADLAARQKQLESADPGATDKVRAALRHWQKDPDLAGLRDAGALQALSPEEQQACRRLWADVRNLAEQAGSKVSKP
jgi:serine/threonine-protein kinase